MSVVLFDVGLDLDLHVVRLLEQHWRDLRVDLYSNRWVDLQLGARPLAHRKPLGARLRAHQGVQPSRLRRNRLCLHSGE